MRSIVFLAILLASLTARAQNSCSGSSPQMTLGLEICPSSSTANDGQPIAKDAIPYVVNRAECECNSMDLCVFTNLVSNPLPAPTDETLQVWLGTNCSDKTQRTSTTSSGCKQITQPNVSIGDFQQGSSSKPIQSVPVPTLISPLTAVCTSDTTVTNSMWFLFFKGGGGADVDNACSLQIQADLHTPETPKNVTATTGDGAVVLKWDTPSQSSRVNRYQVLCAQADGTAVPGMADRFPFNDSAGQNKKLSYSTCVNGKLYRQFLASSGSVGTVTDGGTGTSGDGGASTNADEVGTDADALDGGTSALSDGGTACPTASPFGNFDPQFLCSIASTTLSSPSIRVDKLTNGQAYQFMVVAIDRSGNPAGSTTVCATPLPAEDLYRRFRNQGGKPQSFCFIATAAYGSPVSPYVEILRDFRDQVLAKSRPGRAFIAWYYRHSPPAAEYIEARPTARLATRVALWPVILASGLSMWLTTWQWALLAALGAALVIVRRRSRA